MRTLRRKTRKDRKKKSVKRDRKRIHRKKTYRKIKAKGIKSDAARKIQAKWRSKRRHIHYRKKKADKKEKREKRLITLARSESRLPTQWTPAKETPANRGELSARAKRELKRLS